MLRITGTEESMEKKACKIPYMVGISILLWPYPASVYKNKAAGLERMTKLTSL